MLVDEKRLYCGGHQIVCMRGQLRSIRPNNKHKGPKSMYKTANIMHMRVDKVHEKLNYDVNAHRQWDLFKGVNSNGKHIFEHTALQTGSLEWCVANWILKQTGF